MHTIRTAEELARLLASTLDPELKAILAGHQERLSAYPDFTFEELAMIVIAEPGDRLAELVGGGGGRFPEQGLGKTTWIGRLVPEAMRQEWMKLDHHLDPGNKDSVLGAVCHWIVEIGELDSSFRKDVARLKGFLTNDFDKIRPPYAKSAIEMPRRTVFAATVNERNFLVDDTGNSRWLTLPVTKLDYSHDIDMQQVFAQLAVELAQGEQWWLTQAEDALLETCNAQHRTVSAIAERLKDRLVEGATGGRYMTASEVLREIGITSFGNPQCKEAGAVLRTIYGPPKRVQGRDRWQVVARSHEDAWQRSGIEIEEY